jgi:anti-sigma regulatory factor (Ser/Thr protein kinase)
LDAGADEISIQIKIDSFDKPDTLKLIIKDNGKGFIDRNFKKFSKLLEVDNNDHKGLGRLVYLVYFDKVEVESYYEGRKKRIFTFDSSFNGKSKVGNEERISGSSLYFDGYLKDIYI